MSGGNSGASGHRSACGRRAVPGVTDRFRRRITLWTTPTLPPAPLRSPNCKGGLVAERYCGGYFTLTPVQADSTPLTSALSLPYRSVAAFTVASRAAL